jgi:sulfonate transport system ATP-binding protein
MTQAPDAVVDLLHVTKAFGQRPILADVNLRIERGQFVALLGASGSGKTTLLRILLGLDTIDSGTGDVPSARAVVFQEPRLVPSQRVWRNVLMGVGGRPQRRRALEALAEVGLTNQADCWPRILSGGEAQRVALARALILEPELLLLDEPFAALDALTRLRMQDLVRSLHAAHRPAVLLVTHDVEEALQLADRVLVLRDARLILDLPIGDAKTPASATGIALRNQLFAALGVDRRLAHAPGDAPLRHERPLHDHVLS